MYSSISRLVLLLLFRFVAADPDEVFPVYHHQEHGAKVDPLKAWIKGVEIPLIANLTGEMPMGMGMFTIKGGYCTGLELDRVESEDLSVGPVLEYSVKVLGLGITCFVHGYTPPPFEGMEGGDIDINISFAASSVNASIQINPYTVTSMMSLEDFLLPMGRLNLTSCSAGMAATSLTHAGSGFLAETLTSFVEMDMDVAEVVGGAINEPLCEGLKSFLETNGTDAAAEAVPLVSILLEPPLPNPEPTPLKKVLDWESYPPVGVAKALLNERFGLFTDRVLSIVNSRDFNQTLWKQDEVLLKLSSMNIEGTGEKHGPGLALRTVESSLGIEADLKDLTFTSGFDLAVTLPDQPLFKQQLGVTLGLTKVALGVRAMVDESTLNALHLDEAMHSPRCLVQCAEGTADPAEAAIAVEDLHVELRPLIQLHTPGSRLATDGSNLINNVLGGLFRGYGRSLNTMINGGLGIIRPMVDGMIWDQLRKLPPCSRDDMYFALSEDGVHAIWSAAVGFMLLGLPVALLAHFFWKRPTQEAPPADVTPSAREVKVCSVRTSAAMPLPTSLACDPSVPRALAVFYPFAIFAVMMLFLYADLDIGTTVTMVMEADGKSAQVGPLFSFSLVSTVSHCWSSGAYFIAVLTVIASGVWPFVKLVALLVAWLVPPRCFSVWRRGKILAFLDAWGKYSFLDSWFLVLTLSAFALEWMSVGSADLKIQTMPAPAFYAFFAATVLSLVLGHVASEFHNSIEKRKAANSTKSREETAIEAMGGGPSKQSRARLCSFAADGTEHKVMLVALATSALVAFFGTVLPSFSFEMSGIAPQFLFGGHIEKKYSLLSVGMSVAAGRWNDTGLIGLEVVFLALAVIVPSVLLWVLFTLWLSPLTLQRQRSLLHACRLLDAWASFDVAALVLAIACGEFARLADWLVYEGTFAGPCQMIKEITRDECMKIEFHAFPALTALFIAGAALLIVPKVAMKRFEKAMSRRAVSRGKEERHKADAKVVGPSESNPSESSPRSRV